MIVIRRIARIIGSFAAFFFLVTIVGQAIVINQVVPIPIGMFTALTSTGVIIAWRWERIGGFLTTLSALALGAVLYPAGAHDPVLAASFYSLPFLVPGVLFLLCSRNNAT